jgi:hypothetical protein
MKKNVVAACRNMGIMMVTCTAAGIVLGALFQNIVLWLFAGAGIGTIVGAILSVNKS